MPESPASAYLPEGKRGGGGGRSGRGGRGEVQVVGHPGAPSSAGASISGSFSGRSRPPDSGERERGERERDRGGGGIGGQQRDDLSGPNRYSAPDPSPAAAAGECDVSGRSGGPSAGVSRTAPESTTTTPSSGDFGPAQPEPPDADASKQFNTSGMDVVRMQQELIEYTDTLFLDGLLDEQFTQLQLLQDSTNPDFVSEVVSLFFDDSEKLLTELTESLKGERIDYKKVDAHVHQFKGSSSSIGAQRVKSACVTFRQCCEEENIEGCRQALAQVKQEFLLVKTKLEVLLSMEQQLVSAGGQLPVMDG